MRGYLEASAGSPGSTFAEGEQEGPRRRTAARVRRARLLSQLGARAEPERLADPYRPARVLREHPAQRSWERAGARQLLVRDRNVSRVFTHELVRHRAGSAFSQESLRYVRLTDIGFRVRLRSSRCASRCWRSSSNSRSSRSAPPKSSASTPTACRSTSRRRSPPPAPAGPDRAIHRHRLDRERAHVAPCDRDAHGRGRRGGAAHACSTLSPALCRPRPPTCSRTSPSRTTVAGYPSTVRFESQIRGFRSG